MGLTSTTKGISFVQVGAGLAQANMEEHDFDELKKDWDEQSDLVAWRHKSYEAQVKAVEDQLDTYEIDCAVFKSKRCLEAFDQIQLTRRRFKRISEVSLGHCESSCIREKPGKWLILEFEDMPMRNEEERGYYSAHRSCLMNCWRTHLRCRRTQLAELLRYKQQIETDFLQTDKDPLRFERRPVDSYN